MSAGRRVLRALPNALTVARLLALPGLVVVILRADGPTSPAAAAIFGVVAVTDLLDGALARRLDARTSFGRVADPLADRLLLAVALVGLIVLGRFHPVGPALLLGRDALSVAGYVWLARRGADPRVDAAGKISSALAMVATGGALLLDALWVDVLFWTAVALAVATLGNYARAAARRPAAPGGPSGGE